MKNKFIIIKTTFSSKQKCEELAKILIEQGLSACVQISEILSLYKWSKKVCKNNEFLVNIKTNELNFKKIEKIIKKNHEYDLPQIISVDISSSSQEYHKFLEDNISIN